MTVILAAAALIAVCSQVNAQEQPCDYYQLMISGWNSNDIEVYDACTGDHKFSLDAANDIQGPQAIVRGPDGHIYVASEKNDRILRYDWDTGEFLGNFVWDDPNTPEDESGGLGTPTGLAFGADRNLYVCSFDDNAILRYNGQTGAFMNAFVPPGSFRLGGPDAGMQFGPDGHLYVPNYNNNTVAKFNGSTGAFIYNFGGAGTTLTRPRTLLFHPTRGTLLVSSWSSNNILEFDLDTRDQLGTFITGVTRPTGMSFGPDGLLYVTSDSTNSVKRYDGQDGSFVDTFVPAGSGGLSGATFVYFQGELPVPVPAASTWSILALCLVLMTAATLFLARGQRNLA